MYQPKKSDCGLVEGKIVNTRVLLSLFMQLFKSFVRSTCVTEEKILTSNLQTLKGKEISPARAWQVCWAGINSHAHDFAWTSLEELWCLRIHLWSVESLISSKLWPENVTNYGICMAFGAHFHWKLFSKKDTLPKQVWQTVKQDQFLFQFLK